MLKPWSLERVVKKMLKASLMVVWYRGEKIGRVGFVVPEASRKVFKKPNTKVDFMPLYMLPLDRFAFPAPHDVMETMVFCIRSTWANHYFGRNWFSQ